MKLQLEVHKSQTDNRSFDHLINGVTADSVLFDHYDHMTIQFWLLAFVHLLQVTKESSQFWATKRQ